jgi:Flp pilus assembly protein TadG
MTPRHESRTGWVRGALTHRLGRMDHDADRGSITAYVLIMTVALVVLAGLVLDGGAALTAHGRAADTAQQAARAGADALDETSLRAGTPAGLTANPAAARAAAAAVLAAADITGDITVTGASVTVTARASNPTAILAIVGITRVGGTATAVPLHGTTTGAP